MNTSSQKQEHCTYNFALNTFIVLHQKQTTFIFVECVFAYIAKKHSSNLIAYNNHKMQWLNKYHSQFNNIFSVDLDNFSLFLRFLHSPPYCSFVVQHFLNLNLIIVIHKINYFRRCLVPFRCPRFLS